MLNFIEFTFPELSFFPSFIYPILATTLSCSRGTFKNLSYLMGKFTSLIIVSLINFYRRKGGSAMYPGFLHLSSRF